MFKMYFIFCPFYSVLNFSSLSNSDRYFSKIEKAFHVAEPLMSSIRTVIVQPIRPAPEHKLPGRVPESHEKVRAAAVHGPDVPLHPRTQHNSL